MLKGMGLPSGFSWGRDIMKIEPQKERGGRRQRGKRRPKASQRVGSFARTDQTFPNGKEESAPGIE